MMNLYFDCCYGICYYVYLYLYTCTCVYMYEYLLYVGENKTSGEGRCDKSHQIAEETGQTEIYPEHWQHGW